MLTVTFAGDPLTLEDPQLKVGDIFPQTTLTANDLSSFETAKTSGSRIFLTVPSLDTEVCDLEVRTFNKKAAELPNVSIYVVSADLPFAQARWCGAAGIDAVQTLSDYRSGSFGHATGTYIKELDLLTRAVFVVDETNTITYVEYVPEVTNAPNYEAAYQAL